MRVIARDCTRQLFLCYIIEWCVCVSFHSVTLATRMTQVKFEPYGEEDDIEDYLERVELFLTANSVEDDKRVAYLLSGLGAKAYAVLKNLVAPRAPKECRMDRIKELLVNHFKPRPPVIAERYAFHKRDQRAGESQ